MKKLIIILLITLTCTKSFFLCFAEDDISDVKALFCEQKFDYFLNQLKKISKKYPILSSFEVDAHINKSYIEQQGGMYYGLSLSKNYRPGKFGGDIIDSLLPYLHISFSLSTGKYPETGPAMIFALEGYYRNKKISSSIQHEYRGITIFAKVNSNNKTLEKEVQKVFEKIIDDILDWEKEKISGISAGYPGHRAELA